MRTAYGVYATVAVLAFGAIGFFLPQSGQAVSRSTPVAAERLPKVALADADALRVTKIELTRPDDDDKGKVGTISLEKRGSDWEITSPARARASASKVLALIDNLKEVTLESLVDPSPGSYDVNDLTDAKALHVVTWAGNAKLSDLYFGKSGRQGQLARVAGIDGVFAVPNTGAQGYSGFLYTRSVRSWRETAILQFNPDDAILVEITNANGFFSFSKTGDTWTGLFSRSAADGGLLGPAMEWPGFDESKVKDLLAVYKSLSADDFGSEADKADAGIDNAGETGGIIRIKLKNDPVDRSVRVGKLTESTTRWAIKDSRWAVQVGGDGTLYALSPWTAGWALADKARFENRDASASLLK